MTKTFQIKADTDVLQKIKDFIENEGISAEIVEDKYITIRDAKLQKEKISDINYIDTKDRRICYHLTNGIEKYSKTIQSNFVEEIHPLDENPYMTFIRHGVLINLANVKSVDKRTSIVKFNNGEKLRIAKSYLSEVYEKFYNTIYDLK
jgi:hypothetical protein